MPLSRTYPLVFTVFVLLLLVGHAPLVARASTVAAGPAVSSENAHAVLKRVLAGGEFQRYTVKTTPLAANSWLARHWKDILDAIKKIGQWFNKTVVKPIRQCYNRLVRWLAGLHLRPDTPKPNALAKLGSLLLYLLYILLGAAVLFLLGLLVNYLLQRPGRTAQKDLDALADDPSTRRKQEPSFWERSLREAEALWLQGNSREALRLLHRACLVLLDARGLLRYEESRANGEILRELRRQGHADVQRALAPIIRGFDRGWYGFLPVSNEEFSLIMDSSRQFREAVIGESNA